MDTTDLVFDVVSLIEATALAQPLLLHHTGTRRLANVAALPLVPVNVLEDTEQD
jgi:hypothetical protein